MIFERTSEEQTPAANENRSAEKLPRSMRARVISWVTAAVVLLGFCWLGFVTPVFTEILRGLEPHLPVLTRFSMAYGRFAFPLFGIIGASGIILAENVGRRQRFQA